jgi:hypothetical protein
MDERDNPTPTPSDDCAFLVHGARDRIDEIQFQLSTLSSSVDNLARELGVDQ